jgi:hypothetical protein
MCIIIYYHLLKLYDEFIYTPYSPQHLRLTSYTALQELALWSCGELWVLLLLLLPEHIQVRDDGMTRDAGISPLPGFAGAGIARTGFSGPCEGTEMGLKGPALRISVTL